MFNAINIYPDYVDIESNRKGRNYDVVWRPDGIGAGQWISFWEGVREFHDSRKYDLQGFLDIIDEKQAESLQDRIDDLENDFAELESERDGLEDELVDLQRDYAELEKQHNELQFRIESLEK